METQTIADRIKLLGQKYNEIWDGKKIAIVEDTRFEQDVLQEMFSVLGFKNIKITEYASGQSFLGDLKDDPKRFDVAIVDGELQGQMTGPEAVLIAKAENNKLKLIGRTGKKDFVNEFRKNGADISILKEPRNFLQDFEEILKVFDR